MIHALNLSSKGQRHERECHRAYLYLRGRPTDVARQINKYLAYEAQYAEHASAIRELGDLLMQFNQRFDVAYVWDLVDELRRQLPPHLQVVA